MKLRILLIINAIIAALYGIVILLIPAWLDSLYGFTVTPELNFVGRLLGGYLLAMGILSWLIRNAPDSQVRTAVLYAFLVMDVLGFVVTLIYLLNGTVNAQGWSLVAIFLLLSAGFIYFLFAKPKTE
jgi:predicted membrane-bound spermidine synthase